MNNSFRKVYFIIKSIMKTSKSAKTLKYCLKIIGINNRYLLFYKKKIVILGAKHHKYDKKDKKF